MDSRHWGVLLLSGCSLGLGQVSLAADTPVADKTGTILDTVPAIVDALPTVLPEQSDTAIVAPKVMTQDDTWVDRKQNRASQKLQHYATKIDSWFGTPNPNEANPPSAQLRILLDNEWNTFDGYALRPRIRGKIHLPTLEKRFSLVFGDDTLDNEIRNGIAINNENPRGSGDNTFDRKQSREDNSSLALRWERFKNPWGIKTDADLGIRSGNDLYVRLNAQKDWQLGNDFYAHAEQIYRYGVQSKHYLRTNAELRHARRDHAYIANQASVTYTDNDDGHDVYWDNRLFRQHQFFHDNWFNYGVYMGGHFVNDLSPLSSYGPFVSWRQPLWREWFFVQSEVNYLNDKTRDREHTVGALLRLETVF